MPYFVTPDQIPIYFRDEGPRSDKAIFLIHGEPCNSLFWGRNMEELSRHRRVVALDIRGRGQSGKTEYGHTLSQYARDARGLMEWLGLTEIMLVGWSLGSAVAWRYFEQFGSDRLKGFVNVDQSPYRYVSDRHLEDDRRMARENRLQSHFDTMRYFFGAQADANAETIEWMSYECLKTHTDTYLATFTEAYVTDFRPGLATIDVPTQVHYGSFGSIRPAMADLIVKTTPRCEPVFYEDCGHLIPWVQHEKFNAVLLEFCNKSGLRT